MTWIVLSGDNLTSVKSSYSYKHVVRVTVLMRHVHSNKRASENVGQYEVMESESPESVHPGVLRWMW
jgi:hypothetical protein